MKLYVVFAILSVSAFAKAGYLPFQHDIGHGSSYTVVTQHDDVQPHYKWNNAYHHGVSGHIWSGVLNDYDDHIWNKHAKYEFEYGVKDLKTGDIKNQWEHRDGYHIMGKFFEFKLIDKFIFPF